MDNLKKICLNTNASISEVIRNIDDSGYQISIIVDKNQKLLGIMTDGDIRRFILSKKSFNTKVGEVMNKFPTVVEVGTSKSAMLNIMRNKLLHQIPVVDENYKLKDLLTLDELIGVNKKDNVIFIMAGGLGKRLLPLTETKPKPMLLINEKPIIQIILESFIEQGFKKFFISVNYKSNLIMDYLKDGSNWGVKINYIQEQKRLGTAGSLSLIKEKIKHPLIVINSDVVTKLEYEKILKFHVSKKSSATMVICKKETEIPYGVVNIKNNNLISIEEKPVKHFFINAGIYVLQPEIIELLPKNSYYDMPELFKYLKSKDKKVKVFPLEEYWMDIGHLNNYQKVISDYK